MKLVSLLLLLPTAFLLAAPELTRGPYLQMSAPTSANVRWRTAEATVGTVRYGYAPDFLDKVATESEATSEHEVKLKDLKPSTKVFYQVEGDGTILTTSADCFFTTAPVTGSTAPIRFWVLGDSGTADKKAQAVRDAYDTAVHSKVPAQFMLMLGDNAYNKGTDKEFQEAVFETYPKHLRQLPLWSCIGNHETYNSSKGDPNIPYFKIHTFPTKAECGGIPSGTENYFSFNHGNIHFVVLDSMVSSRAPDGAMAKWTKADLQANALPWTIAVFHHPPYTKGTHDSDKEVELVEMRKNFLPILEAHGVDLVLSGHSHTYERTRLIDGHYGVSSTFSTSHVKNSGSGNPQDGGAYRKSGAGPTPNEGTVYVVAGSSGKTGQGKLNHPAMFISLSKLGSLVIDVNKQRMDVRFLRETGAIDDTFTIIKGN